MNFAEVIELEEENDYETLPKNYSLTANLFAGAFAGIMEHSVMFPVDAIKTRMQIVPATTTTDVYTGVVQAMSRISATEGALALWRGISSVILGAGPSHAVYFGVYEFIKDRLLNFGGLPGYDTNINTKKTKNKNNTNIINTSSTNINTINENTINSSKINKPNSNTNTNTTQLSQEAAFASTHSYLYVASTATAGACATIASESLMNPFDVVKQRMQMMKCKVKTSFLATTISIYRHEGLNAFYVSYPTTLAMTIPFTALNFTTYELVSNILNPSKKYDPLSHCLAGGFAGAIASAATTPLDVIKTLLQTKGTSNDPQVRVTNSLWDAAKLIYSRAGYKGFLRGLRPRVVTNMPSTAISWTSYEMAKFYLSPR